MDCVNQMEGRDRRLGQINHCYTWLAPHQSYTMLRRLELNQVWSEGEIYRTVSVQQWCTLTVRLSLPSWVSHETQNTGSANTTHHPQPSGLSGSATPPISTPGWSLSSSCLMMFGGSTMLVGRCWLDDVCLWEWPHQPPPATTSHCLTLSIAWVASSQQPGSASLLLLLPHSPPLAGWDWLDFTYNTTSQTTLINWLTDTAIYTTLHTEEYSFHQDI